MINQPRHYQQKAKSTVPTTAAIIIVLVVAVISFAAGARAQLYGFIDASRDKGADTNAELANDLDYTEVEALYDILRSKYDGELKQEDLLDGLKKGLAEASGDDYTVYLNEEETKAFNNDLNGTFTGIGAEIGMENDILVVISPLKGFPAESAGLRAGDKILKIDDQDTYGMTVEEAVLKIRGEENTEVTLTIFRDDEQKEIKITREEISLPSVEWEVKDGIGIMTISRFSDDTSELTAKAAKEFKEASVSGVILDLRNNGGGYLSSAVDVAGLWVENSPIVEEREDSGKVVTETLRSGSKAPLKGIKTVVLINGGSASASEIVAGALNDYDVATLIGQNSFGKGSVQSLEELKDGGVLKVTIARWYTPKGNNIDKDGIAPDIEVKMTNKDFDDKKDPQLDKALEQINK